VVAHSITDFSGTNSWCYIFMKKCKRTVKSFKKQDITPTLGNTESNAMIEKGKSLNSYNSNDECNSSDTDFISIINKFIISRNFTHCTAIMISCICESALHMCTKYFFFP
jgi:hypothetical protein